MNARPSTTILFCIDCELLYTFLFSRPHLHYWSSSECIIVIVRRPMGPQITESQPVARDAVEVAHEALIRHWPRLRDWLNEDRAALLSRQSLREAAQEWERNGRDESYLTHRGRRLDAVETLRQHPRLELNAQELAYLDAAIALRQREEREREAQRQRELAAERERAELAEQRATEQTTVARHLRHRLFLAVGFFVVALLGATIAFWAFRQAEAERQQAKIVASKLLAERAGSNDVAPDLALLLSVEAFRIAPTFEAKRALLAAIQNNGPLVATSRQNDAAVTSLAFSRDGTRLVWSDEFGYVFLWNTAEFPGKRPLNVGQVSLSVVAVAVHPDGNRIAWGGVDKIVHLWRLDSASEIWSERLPEAVSAVAFDAGGTRLAAASEAGTVRVWSLAGEAPSQTPIEASVGRSVKDLAFRPDGSTLLLATSAAAFIWQLDDGFEPVRQDLEGQIVSVSYSSDARPLAVGTGDGSLKLWDLSTSQSPTGEWHLDHEAAVTALDITPDGHAIVYGDTEGNLILIDTATQESTTLLDRCLPAVESRSNVVEGQYNATPASGTCTQVNGVTFAPNGAMLAIGFADGSVVLCDPAAHLPLMLERQDFDGSWLGHALSQNSQILAVSRPGGVVERWSANEGRRWVPTLTGLPREITDLTLNNAGTKLGTVDDQGQIDIWDLGATTPAAIPLSRGLDDDVTSLGLSPARTWFAAGDASGAVSLWDFSSSPARSIPLDVSDIDKPVTSLALDSNGTLLAAGYANGTVLFWDVTTAPPTPLPVGNSHTKEVTSLAFSSDGLVLASGSADKFVRLWDMRTQTSHDVLGLEERVVSLALSADTELLAAGLENGCVALWDIATRQRIGLLGAGCQSQNVPQLSPIASVAFADDGASLVAVTSGGTLVRWDTSPISWKDLACRLAGRNLSDEEWLKYLGSDQPQLTCP